MADFGTTFMIYIDAAKFLAIIGSIIGAAWYTAYRLGRIDSKVEGFDTRLTNIEGRLDSAFANASPVSLKPDGQKALEESGFKKWIDGNSAQLMQECKSGNILTNQYDIQEAVFKLFEKINLGEFESRLKEAAFKYGWSEEVMRRVGAIYFRDICLKELGFTP
jgi:hypothetical protein